MGEWTQENMKAVCESLGNRTNFEGYILYAVRFETDGDIALVHRCKVDEYGDPNPSGEWYYNISHMYPEFNTVISDGEIEDWGNSGDYWEGDQSEYNADKEFMEREHKYIYMNV